MLPKIGLVAGAGDLPRRIVEACESAGRDIFVLALRGQAESAGWVESTRHAWIGLGEAGKALDLLRREGVVELVFAGRVKRPSLASLRLDARAVKFFASVGLKRLGDDSLLSAIVRSFEAEGFHVIAPETLLDDALVPDGPFGAVLPDDAALRDIERGFEVAQALGFADVGQGVVVQQGIVLAVEAVEGTDAMLARAGELRRDGPGGVLVKVAKPQQERRIDLPTIGEATVRNAVASGLRGIAVEAGAALVVDRAAVATAADAAGVFVVGVRRPKPAVP